MQQTCYTILCTLLWKWLTGPLVRGSVILPKRDVFLHRVVAQFTQPVTPHPIGEVRGEDGNRDNNVPL